LRVVEGDSPGALAALLPRVFEPALFWLDAHLLPSVGASAEPQCPVLSEIRLIAEWPHVDRSVVMNR
jgi:hypothetical protein